MLKDSSKNCSYRWERKISLKKQLLRREPREVENSVSPVTGAGFTSWNLKMTLLRCIIIYLTWAYSANGEVPVCRAPPEIDFGEILSSEKSKYVKSDRVQYSCNVGYTLAGSEWITCDGRSWTAPPKCLAPCTITKQHLVDKNLFLSSGRRHATVILSGQTMEFSCADGYNFTGPSVRQCIDGHIDFPLCVSETGQKCGRPPVIANGDITTFSKKQYASGSSVEYKCQHFYTLQGKNTIFCINGDWTKPPFCMEPCIISMEEMQNHGIELNERSKGKRYVKHDDFIEFKCQSGYTLQDGLSLPDFTVQCNSGNIVYPQCDKDTFSCGPPPSVQNGDLISDRLIAYSSGSSVEYKCRMFYTMTGSRTVTCNLGRWTALPLCLEKACRQPQPIENGEILSVENGTLRREQLGAVIYMNGAKLKFTCHAGFLLRGTSEITCNKGIWTSAPTCIEMPCGSVPSILNGFPEGRLKDHYKPGETVHYQCQEGFNITGTPNIICKAGNWTKSPTCEDACKASPEIMKKNNIQLRWKSKDKLTPNSEDFIEFYCKLGYVRDPTSSEFRVQCLEGRLQYPKCIRRSEMSCGRAPAISNAIIEGREKESYHPGETVLYQCQSNFRIVGSPTVTCNRGLWTKLPECKSTMCGGPPIVANANVVGKRNQRYQTGERVQYECQEHFEIMPSSYIVCANGEWSQPPVCKAMTCGPAPVIANGGIMGFGKQRYFPGERVRYRCHDGLSLIGLQIITCKDGIWSQPPECKEASGKCGTPPPIDNGDITSFLLKEYESDSQVEYKCQHFYVMEGNNILTCVLGQWTDPPICLEPCTVSEEEMEKNNIVLSGEKKLYSLAGEAIEFECKTGYKRDPTSPALRAQCFEGKLQYPRCKIGS
ncbi:coagulation factor XIII B chain isoform X1 [Alligator mississippiensis]|nr:coagulation factor XIII B chain isoform X1 [Alligator mississippiensis]